MSAARTSATHPLQIAEVRASPSHGRIGITFCPGKHDKAALTGAWARDLDADLDVVATWGAKLVVTLVEPAELLALKVPALGEHVVARGIDWRHLPIADFSVPTPLFERRWHTDGRDIRALLRRGGDVLVHCKGGLGRAGMIAARLLVELGVQPDAAIHTVRRAREGAIETPAQLARVRAAVCLNESDAEVVDTAAWRKVASGSGSNPAGVYTNGDGRRFYVKSLESPAHAHNELMAAKLYQLAGAPTLTYMATALPTQVATEWVDLDKRRIAHLDDRERREAQRWLGVHAWTANWDAAGLDGDNQGVVAGVVLTLDVGGALAFRAHGDPKGRAFGAHVGEVERLRTDPDNPHAVKLFGDMSAAAIDQAIAVVTRIPDAAIRRMVIDNGGSAALAETMVARKEDMARAAR